MLRQIASFDCPKALRDRVANCHKADAVLILVGNWRIHQLVFVFLRDGAERVRHLVSLEDGKPSFFTLVLLQLKEKQGNLLALQVLCSRFRIVVRSRRSCGG